MEHSTQAYRFATALLAAGLAFAGVKANAQTGHANADDVSAVRVHIDNDLFAGRERDRDYTGGFAATLSGDAARDGLLSLDPALARVDRLFVDANAPTVHHARQAGLMVFTPGDTQTAAAVIGDRPYASLIFVSNGRMYVDESGRDAWFSSVSVGVLGLTLAERIHNVIHDAMGSERPRGYDHQVSAGGEPTARYTLARQRLLVADPSGALDVKTTVQGSVGYLTEASAAISMRLGRFDTPWWGFAPELTDYIAAPVPVAPERARPHDAPSELYFFAGARIEARAYNALLQGQFRDSEVTYSYDEIEPIVAQAWIGVVTQIFAQTQLSYTLNYQTAELREGEGARSSIWGGVQLAHAF
ncbi:MAG: lipid A deacylase LpxR family protein [Steroidobacter sp.]